MTTDNHLIDLDARLAELMRLSPEQRIELAERLIASVPMFATPEIERAWNEEIARRVEDIESGRVQMIPAEEVYAAVRRRLDEGRHERMQRTGFSSGHHECQGYVFTIAYSPEEPGYIVHFFDFPEIITSGGTLPEAFADACEALDLHLDSLRTLGAAVPVPKHRLVLQEVER